MKKNRTSFRQSPTSIVETFTYSLENISSALPINIVIHDVAFRHCDWYIIRSSHGWFRTGTNFFSLIVRDLALQPTIEISMTLEYNLSGPNVPPPGGSRQEDRPPASAPPPPTSSFNKHPVKQKSVLGWFSKD
jgi:hypothetical protein